MKMQKVVGRCWIFGDNVDTDVILPTQYLLLPNIRAMREHAFEPIRPEFANKVKKGDIIVAGKNFGCGSSREQAPAVLKELGISAIIARSFARIFYRNAINLGIPVVECDGIHDDIEEGDVIEVDIIGGKVINKRTEKTYNATKIPPFILEIFNYGGLVEYMKQKRGRREDDGHHQENIS